MIGSDVRSVVVGTRRVVVVVDWNFGVVLVVEVFVVDVVVVLVVVVVWPW